MKLTLKKAALVHLSKDEQMLPAEADTAKSVAVRT